MPRRRPTGPRIDRRRARRARVLLWIEGLFALCALVFTVAVIGVAAYVAHELPNIPDLSPLENYADTTSWSLPTKIFAADGSLLATFQEERRDIIPFDRIPETMRRAIVAAEDKHFWRPWHWGIDPVGVARAALANLTAGGRTQGGSTLTMQLARNLFLTRERTWRRKIREAILAIQIERRFTKEEILERYLNKVYFGRQAYGIAAAADRYFGKSLADGETLTLAEAAFLAGLPQAPGRYGEDTEAGIARQRAVLDRMVEDGYITREEARAAVEALPDLLRGAEALPRAEYPGGISGSAPWFAEYVRRILARQEEWDIYRDGLRVHTTIDPAIQAAAETALASGLDRLHAEVAARGGRRARPPERRIEGALVALEVGTGRILALVGGSMWSAKNQFNRAVQARRQPGSAFKPFVHAAALLHGTWGEGEPITAATILPDTPLRMMAGGEVWEPMNYDRTFSGAVTLRETLKRSINIPTISLLMMVGPEAVVEMAKACGIPGDIPPVYSLALGTYEVTPLDLAAAYGVFAQRGVWVEPIAVLRVENREGFVVREYRPQVREAIDPNLADLMTSLMRDVVERGTAAGSVGARLGRPAAGKTGTTDEYTDAWFVGYTPEIVCAVWVGYDGGKISMGRGMTGSHAAGYIWSDFVKAALGNRPVTPFRERENLVEALVDPRTGLRAAPICRGAVAEVFLPGRVPSECTVGAERWRWERDVGLLSDTAVTYLPSAEGIPAAPAATSNPTAERTPPPRPTGSASPPGAEDACLRTLFSLEGILPIYGSDKEV